MNKTLNEIIETAEKALKAINEEIANLPVNHVTKVAYVSVAGSFDSIILLAENAVTVDPAKDAIDRPERHSISGHANDPSPMQKYAFEKSEGLDNV